MRVSKLPLAPPAGAVNVTSAPETLFPSASVTVTASASTKRVPTWVDSAVAMPAVIEAGLPARLLSVKWAMLVVVVVVAVAVTVPEALPAVIDGEVAMPWMPVVAVAVLVPPAKLALAPAPAPAAGRAVPPPSVNVMVAPIADFRWHREEDAQAVAVAVIDGRRALWVAERDEALALAGQVLEPEARGHRHVSDRRGRGEAADGRVGHEVRGGGDPVAFGDGGCLGAAVGKARARA